MSRPLALCTLIALAVFPGCVHQYHAGHRAPGPVVASQHGPPPHAPAHGYRYKNPKRGADLIYDSGLGLYLVAGLTGHYFQSGRYFRFFNGSWQVSSALKGPWGRIAVKGLPRGLRKKAGGGSSGRQGKGRGKGRK